jgi:uncharacterized protein YrrD
MLRRMRDMEGYSISATDGVIGLVEDYYFDDESWAIRYLVVKTGAWLSSRKVLISPMAINQPDWSEKTIPAAISQEQVRNSPDIDTDKPVSRQHEDQYLRYYRYPNYWGGIGLWGAGTYPNAMQPGHGSAWSADPEAQPKGSEDPHLRSGNAVLQYHVHATDGDIGHVQGILIDEKSWSIHFLIVNTGHWWLGHEVIIAPEWIENVSWPDAKVFVGMTRQAIRNSPAYDPAVPFDREHSARVYARYGRDPYRPHEASGEPAIPHLGPQRGAQ